MRINTLFTDDINVQDEQGKWYPIIYSVGTIYDKMVDDIGMEKLQSYFKQQ